MAFCPCPGRHETGTSMTSNRKPIAPGSVDVYPVLPLRDIVVFPHMIVPLFVGREKSIRALEEVMKADKPILLATQMNAADDDPATDAIFTPRTLATVLQLLKLPDGTVRCWSRAPRAPACTNICRPTAISKRAPRRSA